eukprot:m.182747 g.182747  ORF g.182747 m.182747 type:complete len:424 (-) comp32131_c2_seq1:129-1400(-)
MPSDEGDIVAVLKGHTLANKITIIERIAVCHNINLKAENRGLMHKFFNDLIAYMIIIADANHADGFELVNALAPRFYEIAQQMPNNVGTCLLGHVERIAGELRLEGGILSFSDACVLQLIGLLFPTSDFRHKVVTPASIVLGQILSGSMQDENDVVAGLVACTIALDYVTPAKKYVPEALGFLCGMVHAWCGGKDDGTYHYQFAKASILNDAETTEDTYKKLEIQPMRFSWISQCPDPINSQWRLAILACGLDLLSAYATLYKEIPAFESAFAQVVALTTKLQSHHVCANKSIATKLKTIIKFCNDSSVRLRPLTLQMHKAVPIVMLEPDVQEGDFYGRKTDPDKEHRELRKLKHQHKQEKRGAIRELRKDAKFVANVKQRQKADFNADRDAVVKKYENMLANDHGDFNNAERKRLKQKGRNH